MIRIKSQEPRDRRQEPDTPYWNFVDWADGKNWDFGSPPKNINGESALIDMHLLWAYEWAVDMEAQLGFSLYAGLYREKVDQLKQTIREKYWDEAKGLYADTRDKVTFSQHCNALALLTDVVSDENKLAFSKRLMNDSSLTKCSMYFSFYLHQALIKGGLGDDYINWLGPWRESIKIGLTTWAEEPNLNTTRSDCHAWASGPNVEFFRTVLGIDSYSPGFSKIKIEPHVGKLTKISGEIPHPNGKIRASYTLIHKRWNISISIPENTSGIFIWNGITYELKSGNNLLVI
jgi:alpha-L-rhamnosidase